MNNHFINKIINSSCHYWASDIQYIGLSPLFPPCLDGTDCLLPDFLCVWYIAGRGPLHHGDTRHSGPSILHSTSLQDTLLVYRRTNRTITTMSYLYYLYDNLSIVKVASRLIYIYVSLSLGHFHKKHLADFSTTLQG